MPDATKEPAKERPSLGQLMLERAQAELEAAKNHRHWLSGTMSDEKLVEHCQAVVDATEEEATEPAEPKREV